MSRVICARRSSGPLNFFSSRRRSQKRTSMRLGGEGTAGLKVAAMSGPEGAGRDAGGTLGAGCQSRTCVSTLSAEPLNVGRIPTFVTERRLRCSPSRQVRSEEHTSELQSRVDLVCRLLLEKKKNKQKRNV